MFDEQNATKKATSNGHFGKFQITTQEMLFVLFCAFHVGMRKREIIECRRDWVNLEKGFMQIKGTSTFAPKDKEARKVPLSPAFMDYLRRAGGFSQTANQQEEAPYILKPNRKQKKSRYRYDPRKPFERLVSAAGVPWMTLHGARHTFATLLLDQGASISNVAMWLGDDEQVARSHYIHHLSENEHHRHLFG